MKRWTRTSTTIAAGSLAGVLAVGAMVPALAQDADTTEEETEETAVSRLASFAERLAEKLGLDAGDVATAMEEVVEEQRGEFQDERQAALEERLAEAVGAGDLTQEQADAILDAHEAGVIPLGGRDGRHAGRGMRGHGPGFGPGGLDLGSLDVPASDSASDTAATSA